MVEGAKWVLTNNIWSTLSTHNFSTHNFSIPNSTHCDVTTIRQDLDAPSSLPCSVFKKLDEIQHPGTLGHSEFHPDPPLESESAQAQARILLLLLKLIGTAGLHRSGCQT
jgi:hypothetical protein